MRSLWRDHFLWKDLLQMDLQQNIKKKKGVNFKYIFSLKGA